MPPARLQPGAVVAAEAQCLWPETLRASVPHDANGVVHNLEVLAYDMRPLDQVQGAKRVVLLRHPAAEHVQLVALPKNLRLADGSVDEPGGHEAVGEAGGAEAAHNDAVSRREPQPAASTSIPAVSVPGAAAAGGSGAAAASAGVRGGVEHVAVPPLGGAVTGGACSSLWHEGGDPAAADLSSLPVAWGAATPMPVSAEGAAAVAVEGRRQAQWLGGGEARMTPGVCFRRFLPEAVVTSVLSATNANLLRARLPPATHAECLVALAGVSMLRASYGGSSVEEFFRAARHPLCPLPNISLLLTRARLRALLAHLALGEIQSSSAPTHAPAAAPDSSDPTQAAAMVADPLSSLQDAYNAHLASLFTAGTVLHLGEAHVAGSDNAAAPTLAYHTLVDASTGVVVCVDVADRLPGPPATTGALPRLASRLQSREHILLVRDPALCIPGTLAELARQSIYTAAVVGRAQVATAPWMAHLATQPEGTFHAANVSCASTSLNLYAVARDDRLFPLPVLAAYGSPSADSPLLVVQQSHNGQAVHVQCNQVLRDVYAQRWPVPTTALEQSWTGGVDVQLQHLALIVTLAESNALGTYNSLLRPGTTPLALAAFRREVVAELFTALQADRAVGSSQVGRAALATAEKTSHSAAPAPAPAPATAATAAVETTPTAASTAFGASEEGSEQGAPLAKRAHATAMHGLVKVPLHSGTYRNGSYSHVTAAYQRSKCTGVGCNRRTREVCACTPGLYLCHDCFAQHVMQVTD